MIQQMHAMAALAIGNKEEAEAHFKNATRLEAETEYSFGPPDIPYPSFEHYGYWLLENKRYVEAIEQFDKSLARAPKRARALLGKKQALEAIGQMDQVTQVDQIMKDFWVGAD